MTGRSLGSTAYRVEVLAEGWEFTPCPAGRHTGPAGIDDADVTWTGARVPCTVASALRDAGAWRLDGPPRRFDDSDWWFRLRFNADPKVASPTEQWLAFDGLATVADVWLNGQPLLSNANMFTAVERQVDGLLAQDNVLHIRFHALDELLRAKRPRPRWRAPMVEHQQLRWIRTTLLGRTPGWSPPAAAVGPWGQIRLEQRREVVVQDLDLAALDDGHCRVSCLVRGLAAAESPEVVLELERGGRTHRAPLLLDRTTGRHSGACVVADVERWWPHTHGTPALYEAGLAIRGAGVDTRVPLGRVGFRSVRIDREDGGFRVHLNGVQVFCRGACWTPLDVVSLGGDDARLRRAFDLVVDGGMNMLRLCGPMTYESRAFLDLCDERGVLLWHDLMFANLDYPEDPAFVESVSEEVRQRLRALQGRPSLAVVCGNSEGEQQAAMWGAERARWEPALFHTTFAAISRELLPEVPYWPSSAHGGDFPHQVDRGTSSYYGVGAYLRPPDDARRSDLRFATECLGFANIPEDSALATLPGGLALKSHDPAWKTRTPRDLGAGWDFDDVRDHYLRTLFAIDPLALRYADHARYLELSRVVTGIAMEGAFAEWRRRDSRTGGALVWFLRDLWNGAGWGVVDADGTPKAAWHFLRRALAPLAVHVLDEGVNGLSLHVANDAPRPFRGELSIELVRDGDVRVGQGSVAVDVAAHSTHAVNAATLFDGFRDLTHAYRFGPPGHDIATVTLRDTSGAARSRAYHFIGALPSARVADVGLAAECRMDGAMPSLVISAARFALWVHVEVPGHEPEDDYFHLPPGESREVRLRPRGGAAPPTTGKVRALNAEREAAVKFR